MDDSMLGEEVECQAANLWLSMLRHVGVEQEAFANSNCVIKDMGFV